MGSIPRSPKWEECKREFEKTHPKVCAVCGGTKNIQLHHKSPFHNHPELELDPNNLIWLCEDIGKNHHLIFGHFGNFRTKWNPDIVAEAALWQKRLLAKDMSTLTP